jgi:His-Xaa-Ser system protein HxsD
MEIDIQGNKLLVYVEKGIYNDDVLHKCFYWYSGDFNVDISNSSETLSLVQLQSKAETQDWSKIIEKIKRDLIDFKLRDIVTKETKSIRELIIAKAFAYYGLNDEPITEISDPVGIDLRRVRVNE